MLLLFADITSTVRFVAVLALNLGPFLYVARSFATVIPPDFSGGVFIAWSSLLFYVKFRALVLPFLQKAALARLHKYIFG